MNRDLNIPLHKQAVVAKAGLTVTQAKDVEAKLISLDVDVVIVGSGAGGAVTAYELAKAGQRVLVLESGPYVPSHEFRENFDHALSTLYAEKGTQANADGDLLVLQGRCVGGSTVVNGCVAFRTPEHVLKSWQQTHGLSHLSLSTLAPYFERVEQNLSIHTNAAYEINTNSHKIIDGCNALGVSWKPLQRNIKSCALTGHCLSGCASDRKQSMLVTYLPWAVAEGAEIYADTHVTRVLAHQGHATGVEAEVRNPQTGQLVARMQVKAKRVVLAAGAVQTPLLLLRSELANSSTQVGKNFACHPSMLIVGDYPERVDSWQGALLGVYVDEWAHPDKGGFLLEAGGAGPVELSGVADPGTGKPYIDYMSRVGHLAGLVTLIHDRNVGDISQEKAGSRISYKIADSDFSAMLASIKAAASVHFAGGATCVYLPTVKPLKAYTDAEVEYLLSGLENEPHTFRMVSYHPQGTCRMGTDAKTSVVNGYGESHDVKGLHIVDASLFPSSIMVNPQVTVYTLATYFAEHMLQGINS